MSKMRYQAVIFDFYGTLVQPYSSKLYGPVLSKMAKNLEVPLEEFMNMWIDNIIIQRTTGLLPTDEAAISYICHTLNIHVNTSQIVSAANKWLTFERQAIKPLPDAIPTLTSLKKMGLKIGLITNCGPNLPQLWPDTAFASLVDVPMFSSIVGLRKPDSRLYQHVCNQMAVQPEFCLYVGDGGVGELYGAAKVGMYAVLIRTLANTRIYEPSERGKWQGTIISSLKEILSIL
jgi:putative hydrolase of the HAD superfamily